MITSDKTGYETLDKIFDSKTEASYSKVIEDK